MVYNGPTFVRPNIQGDRLKKSLIGFNGNGSSLSVAELEGASELHQESTAVWGEAMLTLHRPLGVTILGGCCGTSKEHLQYLADHR